MGNLRDVVVYFVFYALAYAILFLIVPFLAGTFIHRGFQKFKIVDVPLRNCLHACYYASSATVMAWFLTAFVVKVKDGTDKQLVLAAVYVGTQLVVVPLLLKQRSGRALLIEAGGILAAIVCGYGLVTLVSSIAGD